MFDISLVQHWNHLILFLQKTLIFNDLVMSVFLHCTSPIIELQNSTKTAKFFLKKCSAPPPSTVIAIFCDSWWQKSNHWISRRCIYSSFQDLILEDSPTAVSIRVYHSPMCVLSTISLPALKCLIGRRTPKTARSAKLGLEPPVDMITKRTMRTSFKKERKNRICYWWTKIKECTKKISAIESFNPCFCSFIQSCAFIGNVIFLLQILGYKIHGGCPSILYRQPLCEAKIPCTFRSSGKT